MRQADADGHGGTALVAADPYSAVARAAALFEQRDAVEPGAHPQSAIDPTATIDPGAHIGAFASIGARSVVQTGPIVGPGCVVGDDCVVGAGSELVARVVLVKRVPLGQRVLIPPGAARGADGFGLRLGQAACGESGCKYR